MRTQLGARLLMGVIVITSPTAFGQATFELLGDLPGGDFYCEPRRVSADGSVVVGISDSANSPWWRDYEAFRWENSVMEALGHFPGGHDSKAKGVSADGSIVVGYGGYSMYTMVACRWVNGQIEDLGMGQSSHATGVSADGSVIAGFYDRMPSEAFCYQNGVVTMLGDLPGGGDWNWANDISADGNVIVGRGSAAAGGEAFRWRGGVMTSLGDLPGGEHEAEAYAASADGSVIVGRSSSENSSQGRFEAFRWTAAGGMQGLGDLPDGEFSSAARGVSGDGSVVVGHGTVSYNSKAKAFIWTAEDGMRDLQTALADDYGLHTGELTVATDISDDGRTIIGWTGMVGSAGTQGWIVHLPKPMLEVTIAAEPEQVNLNSICFVTMKVRNIGSVDLLNVKPGDLVQLFAQGQQGKAEWVTGPDPAALAILPPGVYTEFAYTFRGTEAGVIWFDGWAEGEYDPGGGVQTCESEVEQSNQVLIGQYALAVTATPEKIRPDGESKSQIKATLKLEGDVQAGKKLEFTADKPLLLAGPGNPKSKITKTTDGMGSALCDLLADDEEGKIAVTVRHDPPLGADVTADCEVEMLEYVIELEASTGRYYQVPGTPQNEYTSVDFPPDLSTGLGLPADVVANPCVTVFGKTQAPITLKLTGPDASHQMLDLSSDLQDRIGEKYITFPVATTTNANGVAEFVVTVEPLYAALGVDFTDPTTGGEKWPRSVRTEWKVDVKAKLADTAEPEVVGDIDFPVIDNYNALVQMYEAPDTVAVGLYHTAFMELLFTNPITSKYFTEEKWNAIPEWVRPGILTNVWSFEGHTLRISWLKQFDPFTCGNYGNQVLNALDRIRLVQPADGPQADWLLNGLDYGPVAILGGCHQAVVVWPHDRPGNIMVRPAWMHEDNVILDPWPGQMPAKSEFIVSRWEHDFLMLGMLKHFLWGGGSSNCAINENYPTTGNPYPTEPIQPPAGIHPPPLVYFLFHCPIDVTITDASGNRTGYVPGKDEEQKIYATEIPGSTADGVLLEDETPLLEFCLPNEPLTVDIEGYDDGEFSVLFVQPGATDVIAYVNAPIAAGQRASMRFDPQIPAPPAIVLDDGQIVLPDQQTEVAVPDVVGQTQEQAEFLLTYVGLAVGEILKAEDDSAAAGIVISSDPPPGTTLSAGTVVKLMVSLGPDPSSELEAPGVLPPAGPCLYISTGMLCLTIIGLMRTRAGHKR